MNIKHLCLFALLTIFNTSFSKILIFTYAYNRPDFIQIQYNLFNKFLVEKDWEFIVYSDAPTVMMQERIKHACNDLGIECINFPQELHEKPYLPRTDNVSKHAPSVRHATVAQYSLNTKGFNHDDIVVLLDADLFLTDYFSIRDYMKDCDLAGFLRADHMRYMWLGLIFMNIPALPDVRTIDLNVGIIDGQYVDSAGHTYQYIVNHPHVRMKYFDVVNFNGNPRWLTASFDQIGVYYVPDQTKDRNLLHSLGFNDIACTFISSGIPNIQYYLDNKFFHYMAASNWENNSDTWHAQKTELFNWYMKRLLE
jgi:hypothetical protein